MINAVVLGLGWWGRKVIGALADSDRIRVTAAAARHNHKHREFADAAGVPLVDRYDEMLARADVDAVILCTPNSQHEEQFMAALAAGKQVFCEKPLSLTKASAERMVAAAAKAGIVMGVGHERRFEPAASEIKRIVESDAFGTPMHIEANWSHDILAQLPADNWRGSVEEAPVGAMTGMGVHLTDLFLWFFGPVEAVCAQSARRVLGFPTGDVAVVQFRFASGATATLSVISATAYYGRVTVFGERMWVESRDTTHPQHGGPTLLTTCDLSGQPHTRTLDAFDPVKANLEAWADAVERGGPYPWTDDERVGNVAVLEAIAKSAKHGRWETV